MMNFVHFDELLWEAGPLKMRSTRSCSHTRVYKTSRVEPYLVIMPQEISLSTRSAPYVLASSPSSISLVKVLAPSIPALIQNGVLIRISRDNSPLYPY